MKVVIQKSGPANVEVEGVIVGEIKSGYVILLGIKNEDTEAEIEQLVEKILNLRLFADNEKHFEKSLLETNQEVLIVSQFTLYANCKKGRRPDFNEAAKPETAKPLYEKFIQTLKEKGINVASGKFGAMMHVTLVNQGPITIILET